MYINFKGRDLDLSFGLKFLNNIDRDLGFNVDQMQIGQGLEMLVPNLDAGNIVALSKVIKAATAHHKKGPKIDEDLEVILEDIIENSSVEEFCDEVIEELGKRPLTQNLVNDRVKENNKAKKAAKK
ncbi:tail assembly chaperone [Staphylococcus delphini]|uniref:tail assembly chaperone n=1 Tax=Staphylococcus delphini TaxID=53344 RepID=UPI000BBCC93D|nr:tail assembly chaperone [Staphylococcus delphini]PCF45489.1 phage tail protein [Staphylococcus delphini]